MRILFVAPTYMGLCQNISDELVRQGNDVVFIADKPLKFNYRFQYHHNSIVVARNFIFKVISNVFISYKRYWEKKLTGFSNLYFDTLFVVNGFSYDSHLLNILRKYNPNIRTKLYIWDNLYAYNFNNVILDFENCYTLDYLDSENVEKLNFLPAFWINDINRTEQKRCFDVFLVGTNHDDRYFIAKKVISQLRSYNLTYFIKLIDKFRLKNDIITHKYYSTKEYVDLMKSSKCILDTERPSQTGPTVRLIWALALGKKIISTNEHMKKMPFYNPDQILIINRKNPILDRSFFESDDQFEPCDYIKNLRIDKWIKTILQ